MSTLKCTNLLQKESRKKQMPLLAFVYLASLLVFLAPACISEKLSWLYLSYMCASVCIVLYSSVSVYVEQSKCSLFIIPDSFSANESNPGYTLGIKDVIRGCTTKIHKTLRSHTCRCPQPHSRLLLTVRSVTPSHCVFTIVLETSQINSLKHSHTSWILGGIMLFSIKVKVKCHESSPAPIYFLHLFSQLNFAMQIIHQEDPSFPASHVLRTYMTMQALMKDTYMKWHWESLFW